MKAQSQPVTADDFQDQLCQLSSRNSSPSLSSTTSERTLTLNEVEEEDLHAEQEAYDTLLADGGRPSHPISLGFRVLHSPGNYADILWFWRFISGERAEFRDQLAMWQEFRGYQARVRDFYVQRNRFHEYEHAVRESQQDIQGDWDIPVHQDLHQQNRLENWNEFRAYHYQELKAYERRIEPAELKLVSEPKELEAAQSRLPDAILDRHVLCGRAREVVASKQKLSDARSRFEAAQQALQSARLNKSMTNRRTVVKVRAAEKDLCSAKAKFDDSSESDEMRRLREGYELLGFREGVTAARGRFKSAELDVRRWKMFLRWVDDQYSVIASECGYLRSISRNLAASPHQSSGRQYDTRTRHPRPASRRSRGVQGRSVLSPKPSKISKASKGKSTRRHKEHLLPSGEPQTYTRPNLPSVSPFCTTAYALESPGRTRQLKALK